MAERSSVRCKRNLIPEMRGGPSSRVHEIPLRMSPLRDDKTIEGREDREPPVSSGGFLYLLVRTSIANFCSKTSAELPNSPPSLKERGKDRAPGSTGVDARRSIESADDYLPLYAASYPAR